MFGKHLLFFLLLAAVAIGPILYFNGAWPNFNKVENAYYAQGAMASAPVGNSGFVNLAPSALGGGVATIPAVRPGLNPDFNPSQISGNTLSPTALPNNIILPGNAAGPDANAIPLEFMPVTALNEIFRFDVGPEWVRQRWERVTIRNGESGLSGLRVPLVTGVNTYDLFGSLTYYFDSKKQLQKITFRGWTGDAQGLVQFVTSHYGFKNQPTAAAGLYVAKTWTKSTGALYMQYPNVVRSENPTQQLALLLEINNPNGRYALSSEVASIVFNKRR